ncbi:MAG: methylated-DNA--[protein]-cysteine S-methyltransferase [Gammaproteobacteria bacterium]|nr:methylated-DNA--[protein]-cysteine S-methyltransferase [Gammaproteobacteria bacterium]MYG95249.1 methylated-DNA--[protein]-cysteine S-methyltransferase [Gammaproteobacteria bacterium]
MATYYIYTDSPIGSLLLAGDGDNLHTLGFPGGKMQRRHEPGWTEDAAPFAQAIEQLRAYFAGELERFDLPLAPAGTEFQRKVWAALQDIPYGETRSYGELARQVGNGKASRAVGAANGRNPIPVIIPCHRVVGSDGSLTGFGGGLETKRRLLDLELTTLVK